MANISSAYGTLTLMGNWSAEAIELFHPVLKAWEFHGEFGLRAYGRPTPNRPNVGFSGTGRWSFSGTLDSFDNWTRDWIKHSRPGTNHPLTQEQYDAFLQVMERDDLSIRVEFNDKGEEGYDLDEVGRFTSDGECLSYETLSCVEAEHDWTEVSRASFDGAVQYFQSLAPDADSGQIKKWVKVNIGPSSLFLGGTACLEELYAEDAEGTFDEERFQDFCATFSPKGKAWDAVVEECKETFDWEIDPENHPAEPKIPFWVEHADELEVELEEGQVTYTVHGGASISAAFTNIAEHEELRRRYGWRDEFPWDVPTWKDVKQAAVGRDYVIRIKTDGTAVSALHEGYFNKFDTFTIYTDGDSPIVDVAAGWEDILVLRENGTVSDDVHGYIKDEFQDWTDITAIVMGANHSVGLKKDGTVKAAGENRDGQCDTVNWTGIAAVAAGGNRTFGLKSDGTVVIAGAKGCEAAAGWTDVAALDAGEDFAAGLTRDGRVLLAGKLSEGMEDVLSWTGITAIAAGGWHILGLRADGTVLAAGLDNKGQCQVADWTGVASIAAGNAISIGVKADGTGLCAGDRYAPDEELQLSVSLNVNRSVVHNGSSGKLEPGMTLSAMDHTGEVCVFSSDDLEYQDGADTTIRSMIFRLSPEGTWRRVANSFDPANYGQIAEQVARLEERFGGQFQFDEIFAESADEEDDEPTPDRYNDFLLGAMELLLGMKLRMEITELEHGDLPHFLDEDGNEYFFGWLMFVLETHLSLRATSAETGETMDLTEEQQGQILESLLGAFQNDDSNWTEVDEAWYQAWRSNRNEGPQYEDEGPDDELGPLCIPFDSGEPVKVKGSRFVLAGYFDLCGGDKDKITYMIKYMGGSCTDSVTKATDYVVLGAGGLGQYGRWTYVKAREQIEQGRDLRLIREEDLAAALGDDLWDTVKESYQETQTYQETQNDWWNDSIDFTTVELPALDFQGKRFVLTGTFQHAPEDRDQVKTRIEANGGKCTGSVSDRTDYLVLGSLGEVGEKKVWQARQLQAKGCSIQVISEETLYRFL